MKKNGLTLELIADAAVVTYNVRLNGHILAVIDFSGPRGTIYTVSGWLSAEDRRDVYRLRMAARQDADFDSLRGR